MVKFLLWIKQHGLRFVLYYFYENTVFNHEGNSQTSMKQKNVTGV